MKAKVIETGEIIEVKSLYPVTYSRLDCNGKVIEEYDEDELEFIPNPNRPKMVSLDKVCKYLYRKLENGKVLSSQLIDNLREEMEE